MSSLDALVQERVTVIAGRTFDEICRMPECREENVDVGGRSAHVTTFHEVTSNGMHRVIVQGILERWAGITAKVLAEGIEIAVDGRRRPLRADELYDYT
jgi:hypothetical protein